MNVINGSLLWSDGLYLSQLEAIEDADFFQRHQSYERREKLCWSYWDQDRRNKIRSVCIMVIVYVHLLHIYSSSTHCWWLNFSLLFLSFFSLSTGHVREAVLLCLWETTLLTVTHLYILLSPPPGPSVPVWRTKR